MKTMILALVCFFAVVACETVPLPEVGSDVELKTDVTVGSETSNIDVSKSDATTVDVKQCLTVTVYHDNDKDGWGDKATAILHCADQPLASDWTLTLGDCDDKNSSVHPGAVEICDNGKDDNCNEETDESCVPPPAIDAGSTNAGSDSSDTGEIDAGTTDSGSIDSAVDSSTDADAIDIGVDATSTVDVPPDSTNTDSVQADIGSVDSGQEVTSSIDAGKLVPKDSDPMSCSLLGGKNNLGKCENFCNSCSAGMFCEDTNKDGLGDKCSSIPPDVLNQIPPYYKDGTVDLENSIIIVFEGLPKPASFDESFQTYMYTSQLGWGWTDSTQWQLNSTWLVMELYKLGGEKKQNEGFDNPSTCGIRFNLGIGFNLDDGKPTSNWLCEGNGSTAQLMFKPRFFIVREGVGIEVTKLVTPWSAPNGAGCSALLPIKTMCPD